LAAVLRFARRSIEPLLQQLAPELEWKRPLHVLGQGGVHRLDCAVKLAAGGEQQPSRRFAIATGFGLG
jgi:hypothetical protein